MGVKVLVRIHRRFALPVVDKILCGAMPPQLQFSGGFKGRVLVIDVVNAVHLAQPVGVVEPPGFRHQVVGQTVLIRRHLLPVRLILPVPLFIHFPVYLLIFLHNHSSHRYFRLTITASWSAPPFAAGNTSTSSTAPSVKIIMV